MIAPEHVFSRNIKAWGTGKQQQLSQCSVLVAGVGGLGCTVAQVLVRAGVGRLILMDAGVVDEPDLNRQILYTAADLGRPKIEVAAEKLAAIHQHTTIVTLPMRLEDDPVHLRAARQYAFHGIADCFDTFRSRFVLEKLLTPEHFYVHGGVLNDYGQVTTIKQGITRTLRELYANAEDPKDTPLPVCPSIVICVGTLLAHEVLNNLWGAPQLLNTMLIVELSDFTFSKLTLS